jgi:hypothetical protein
MEKWKKMERNGEDDKNGTQKMTTVKEIFITHGK